MTSGVKKQGGQSLEPWLARFDAAFLRRLVTYFRGRGLRPSDAEDLAQEVFIRVASHLSRGSEVSDLEAYAFAVARYLLLETHKERKRLITFAEMTDREMEEVAGLADKGPTPEDRLEAEEARLTAEAYLEKALRKFPADERELLRAYYGSLGEMSTWAARRALADKLNISENALRVKVHRLRVELRKMVREKMYGRAAGSGPSRGSAL